MKLTGTKIAEIRKTLEMDTLAFADLLLVRSRNTVYGWEGYRNREPPMQLYARAVLRELAALPRKLLKEHAATLHAAGRRSDVMLRISATLALLDHMQRAQKTAPTANGEEVPL